MVAGPAIRSQHRGVFDVDEDCAVAALELAWADGGYHGFSAEGGTWSAISSAGDVLTGDTPDALTRKIRAHWQVMQRCTAIRARCGWSRMRRTRCRGWSGSAPRIPK